MSVTLLSMRTQARQRADMVGSTFISDSELNSYINNSVAELHDIMIQAYGSEYIVSTALYTLPSFTDTAMGIAPFDLAYYDIATVVGASDFYKLVGIDARVNNVNWSTLSPINWNERNRMQRYGGAGGMWFTPLRYRLMGAKLYITPVPSVPLSIRLWYIPTAPILSADGDTLLDLNAYSEYVVVDAAIKMMQKEESDVSVLMAQKVALKRRIEEAANNRDVGKGDSISDIYAEDDMFWL